MVEKIDQIILSTNEDPTYFEFWESVSYAYKKMFPNVRVHIALLTWRKEDDPMISEMRKKVDVTLFKPIGTLPEFGQAKMIRFLLASQQEDNVCYIDDIDLFPLSKEFITSKTSKRPERHLLCVGGEVYNNNGCYPISQITGEGFLFKKFINPNDKEYEDLLLEWGGEPMFDERENIGIQLDWEQDKYFSDERLIRRLIEENPVPKFEMERGYEDFMVATLDRYDWQMDLEKLESHGYVNAHGCRPYSKHKAKYEPLLSYIDKNY